MYKTQKHVSPFLVQEKLKSRKIQRIPNFILTKIIIIIINAIYFLEYGGCFLVDNILECIIIKIS